MEKTIIIITLFSADKVRLDEDSVSRVLEGDYPVRVKSKILAAIREIVRSADKPCVVGFLPVIKENSSIGISYKEDVTQDHYGDLALYLAPEAPCSIVSDLVSCPKEGNYTCREEIIRGNDAIIIGDKCNDWSPVVSCLDKAGANSVKCVSIIDNK